MLRLNSGYLWDGDGVIRFRLISYQWNERVSAPARVTASLSGHRGNIGCELTSLWQIHHPHGEYWPEAGRMGAGVGTRGDPLSIWHNDRLHKTSWIQSGEEGTSSAPCHSALVQTKTLLIICQVQTLDTSLGQNIAPCHYVTIRERCSISRFLHAWPLMEFYPIILHF